MKIRLLFKITIILLFISFPYVHSEQVSQDSVETEIQKCNFLENKLLPKKEPISIKRRVLNIGLQFTVPILTSFFLCYLIDYIFLKNKYSLSKAQIALFLLKGRRQAMQENRASSFYDSQVDKRAKELYVARRNIDTAIFSSLFIGTYFLIRWVLRSKEKTELQIVTDLVKDWKTDKKNMPDCFLSRLESLFVEFQKSGKINWTNAQAGEFAKNMIYEIIDYRGHLRHKLYRMISFF